ncbi:anti-sigma factor family protein [Paenibacillus chibensis]|uniref:anti-sigma factor family protein n=1 Tax=Paenibacillus chibensis TaxID=59846 RepID=UPI000FD6C386|nr:anti-sigma factor [Paenibacillus chibensis]MEC0373279.1 anti-sigma factor [Paenibacillus chibensis]
MTCDEAQEIFGLLSDMDEHDPRRRRLELHIATCSDCAAEYEMWMESRSFFMEMQEEASEERAEEVNRNVMDRIYREAPWLIPDQSKPFDVPAAVRKHLSLWIAGFVMVFLCSFLYFMLMDRPQVKETAQAATGILPTGIAGHATLASDLLSYDIPSTNSGIIEPFVVGMGPSHPQYWMVLSVLGVAMALFSLRKLSQMRK